MAAPKGNRFWEARSKHGRDKLFSSPEALWEACCEYFKWVEDNPLYEDKLSFFQGVPSHDVIEKMRAMTIAGACIFLDIDKSTWHAWRSDKDFSNVIAKAEQVIYQQKFTGAAADLLNPNIIARDLGLADKSEVKQTTSVRVDPEMSPEEAARAYQDLMNG